MKTKLLFLLWLPVFCFSQNSEKECADTERQLDTLVKADKYDMAYLLWESSAKCISESINMNGEKILVHLLAAPTTDAQKQKYIAELLKIYESDDKSFPGNKRSNLVKRAKVLQQYQIGKPEEILTLFDRAFKNDNDNFNDSKALYDYFELYFGRFKSGDKSLTEDDVLSKQDDLLIKLNQLIEKSDSGKRDYQTAFDGIKAIAASINTCEKLTVHYEKKYPANKANISWLQNATENLISQNCISEPILKTIASEWHAKQPGAKSAYNMGIIALRSKGDQAEGLKYFNESVELEKDPARKADTYLAIASLYNASDTGKAIGYVKKAMGARPNYGKPYFLLAQLYLSTGCGETPFEKKALFLLASQTAAKAAAIDPSLKSSATIIAEKYLKKAPSKEEIKEAKQSGKTIKFACGINESVTIPQ